MVEFHREFSIRKKKFENHQKAKQRKEKKRKEKGKKKRSKTFLRVGKQCSILSSITKISDRNESASSTSAAASRYVEKPTTSAYNTHMSSNL